MTQGQGEEEVLRRALRPVEPPAGFADRVMERARGARPGTVPRRGAARMALAGPMARWATAAVLVAGVTGGVWYRAEQRRQAEGEAAKRQVLLSLQIAGSKLQHVRARVNPEP